MPQKHRNLSIVEIWDLEDKFSALAGRASGARLKPARIAPPTAKSVEAVGSTKTEARLNVRKPKLLRKPQK